MKRDATEYFVCPADHGDLALDVAIDDAHEDSDGDIESGTLVCQSCGKRWPIVRGVPRFVEGEDYTDTFGRQWTRWARTQHDSQNGTDLFKKRLQRYTGWDLEALGDAVVVDAGCGPGGFIDVLENRARAVVGFDLSVAIDAAYKLHGRHPRVYLAQGDIFNPPVRPGIADRLFSFGVVQHTPDPERAFRSLIPLVKPGGEIGVWVYQKGLIPQPSYWMRRLTRGMPEPRATRFIEWYVPKALALSSLLGRIPRFGRRLRRIVPVADYRERLPLSPEQQREWALMDTHDMLITRYTFPQRWSDLVRWTKGLEKLRRPDRTEMAAVASRPHSSHS